MNRERFWLEHSLEALAAKFQTKPTVATKLLNYLERVGGVSTKEAVKILKSAESPSTKKLIQILKLDTEDDQTHDPVDEAHINQHDNRAQTYSPQNQPASQFYSLFSVPSGEPGGTTPG